ncbi:MAG: nuclear transport factor 2 family protein, partial [Acidimicrobiales bacterium]
SYMYAQHYLEGSEGGDFFLLRGSYTNHMLRTPDGWRIERLTQHASWSDGNQNALTEATARSQA